MKEKKDNKIKQGVKRQRRKNNKDRKKKDDTNKTEGRITKNCRWRETDSIKIRGRGKR
jgi:hypothetical protein